MLGWVTECLPKSLWALLVQHVYRQDDIPVTQPTESTYWRDKPLTWLQKRFFLNFSYIPNKSVFVNKVFTFTPKILLNTKQASIFLKPGQHASRHSHTVTCPSMHTDRYSEYWRYTRHLLSHTVQHFWYVHCAPKKLCPFYFCNIFGFCWPILTFFSPLFSEMISACIWSKLYHLTSS